MSAPSAREAILTDVRRALARDAGAPLAPLPASARIEPRRLGEINGEVEALLAEIRGLGGLTRRLPSARAVPANLRELVETENIKKAMVWCTPELQKLGIADSLRGLGVEIVPAQATLEQWAACDLGVTGVEAALPETGTLLLRSAPDMPRVTSLLPRIHLALLHPSALRGDLPQAFAEVKSDGYVVCITGPSRTSDIELTLTIGVHGPKTLYVWLLDS